MTFLAEAQIEARAAELWRTHSLQPGFDIERLLDHLELSLSWESVDDSDGRGDILGQLVPSQHLVILNERHLERLEHKEGRLRRYTLGHEIGHWILHAEGTALGASSLFAGERIMCRDGSGDSIERQAEMFAAALLIPRDTLKEALPTSPWRGWEPVYRLADAFVVNVTPMKIRLEQLGWMHRDGSDEPVSGPGQPPGQGALFGS
jgi:IrrE N-terminal-like domain